MTEILPPAVRLSSPGSAPPPPETGGALARATSRPFEPDAEMRALWDRIAACYPKRQGALMGVLHSIQDREGFLSKEAIAAAARFLEISEVRVWEVATFYPMYRTRPGGRHRLKVCHNLSCDLRGARGLLATLRERLGARPGETTSDGLLTLETVECLAACDGAPVVELDGECHMNLTAGRLRRLLDALLAKDAAGSAPE